VLAGAVLQASRTRVASWAYRTSRARVESEEEEAAAWAAVGAARAVVATVGEASVAYGAAKHAVTAQADQDAFIWRTLEPLFLRWSLGEVPKYTG